MLEFDYLLFPLSSVFLIQVPQGGTTLMISP